MTKMFSIFRWVVILVFFLSQVSLCFDTGSPKQKPQQIIEKDFLKKLSLEVAVSENEIINDIKELPPQIVLGILEKVLIRANQEKAPEKKMRILNLARLATSQISDRKAAADVLIKIAYAYNSLGEIYIAISILNQSKLLLQGIPVTQELAVNHIDLSILYLRIGRYRNAQEEALESNKLVNKIANNSNQESARLLLGRTLITLANAFEADGQYKRALEFNDKAVNIYGNSCTGKIFCVTRIAELLTQRGRIYRASGNHIYALDCLKEAYKLASDINSQLAIMDIFNSIGVLFYEQSDYLKAIEYYTKSLDIAELMKESFGVANAKLNIGMALSRQGKFTDAMKYYQQCLELFDSFKDEDGIVATKKAIAIVHAARGEYEAAHKYLESCIKMTKAAGDTIRLAESLWYQGQLRYSQKNYAAAAQSAKEALAISMSFNLSRAIYDSSSALGKALFAQKDYEGAAKALHLAIANIERSRQQVVGYEQERMLFFEDKVNVYHTMMDLLLAQGKVSESFLYAEKTKGRVLLDSIREGHAYDAKLMTDAEREEESNLRSEIVRLNTQLVQQHKAPSPEEASIPSLTDQLEKARVRYEDFYAQAQTRHLKYRVSRGEFAEINLNELKKTNTEPELAALEYVITEDKVYLYLLDNTAPRGANGSDESVKVFILPISADSLKKEVALYSSQIASHKIDFKARGARLYEVLFKPVEELLAKKKRLCIIPDGALWELPFQALITSENKYLLEKYSIFYSPSLLLLNETERRAAARSISQDTNRPVVVGIGNPQFGDNLAIGEKEGVSLTPLPEAEREVMRLAEIYPTADVRTYLKTDPTEEVIKSEIGKASILHFATHGILDNKRPLYSFLVMAKPEAGSTEDGMLEAWEIAQLKLNADLAILSACESGKGKVSSGEGMVGMAWAFMIAGVPTTVVSQWKVDSASTSQLMTDLHHNLAQSRQNEGQKSSNSQALRDAAIKLMDKPQYRHPFFWAGFIVLGSDH